MKIKTRPSTGIITVTIGTADGRRTVSTGTTDPKLARKVIKAANLEAVEVMAKAGTLTQNLIHKLTIGGTLSVEQVIAEWEEWLRATIGSDRTADNHTTYVHAWSRDMKLDAMRICDIRERHISDWINHPEAGKLGTRRVKLAAIHSLFKFCSIREYSMDPSRLVRIKAALLSHEQKEPREKECFTGAEMRRIITHLRDQVKEFSKPKTAADRKRLETARFWLCAVIIGRYAGLRMGDICTLEWSCFSKPGKMIVWTDKRDARVELEIDSNLYEGVSAIPNNNRKVCFPVQDAIIRSKQRSKLSVQFMRILEACDIHGHSFHDLRHTYATDCSNRGIPMPHIAASLGHAKQATTDGYIH